ncbi:glycerol-3-phosphate acyltransferase 3-like isoform X3 [Corythoichthys intestinalis]|uniref:glycerol-3-phosphate acyltransferase 3-like isoform X3 n=1 Tax=Corythoichthys intestinalis TaxID=161448 RepID=UPI0025A52560|nr:glycerol-3-phosphate acyltransferase 3-like isoform X3 [Corythoichthys intestinalis]
MEDFWAAVVWVGRIWLCLIVCLIMIPAMFGFSLGISEAYMDILVKTLEWATLKLQKASTEEQTLKASSSSALIQREDGSMEKELEELRRSRPKPPVGGDFTLSDCFYFTRRGIESIVEDEVTQRFSSEELLSWNLLTRTNNDFQYISLRLTLVYGLGIFVRYCILAPLRITLACIGLTWLVMGTSAVGLLPNSRMKFWLSEWVHVMCYRICARGLSAAIRYHNRLKDHVNDKTKLPILIFPEGTCINNTSVMMFKKGSFEIGATIYPVAIKYDPKFGDAFWNSSKYSMVNYLLRMMTSWALVCNVWYLPAMHQQEGEDAVQFANRVKSAIAHQGGLVDLQWDGGLKRAKVKESFKEEQQKQYSHMVVGDDSSSNSD